MQRQSMDSIDTKQLLKVLIAIKKGDFSVRMPIDQTGIAGKIADTLNDIIEYNERMAAEFQRISITVGKEGKTTQRASLNNMTGGWAACVDSVNTLMGDLVQPTNEMARVIGAVAKGDLSQTISLDLDDRPLQGEFLKYARLVNGMVTQLGSFASEVTRVAREVGTEGKLGGQAEVKGVSGTWKDLTDNVNSMAGNLTAQVRNIAEVTTAVANGDLTKKITVDVKGEILELKNTINTMVTQLGSFASEVTRVAREVGTEGKLGGQAEVKGVSGTWKDLTDNVNSMAGNLTAQVRNIADVTTAVANGDLTKKITVDVKGEILELKNTINTMVAQLSSFASEVTRVAREVGTEGKLGGQAEVKGVSGTWKDLTDNVNSMAGNLTAQVRNIAEVTTAVATGDLTKKITVDVKGEILELKNTINTMVDQLNAFASEVTRVAREVGTEGKLGGQAMVRGVGGTWKDLTDNVNSMAGNLTAQVRNIAEVTTAVATGDLTKKITVDVKGEILELKNTINTMVDQLNAFASEVTRVAREVGTEGKLGGQAVVRGVGGTWKDLTDNVNSMAGNLTAQVRNIAEVTTAVATGDLTKKITVDVRGEILELKNTINTMVDQLNAFASEVTRVAREVGTEGKLGGQAMVRGVGGTWKDLTDNVNFMAGNLTAQVRNIAEVTTAVATGDLTKKITVDVKGEILELKNTINTMVDQLNAFASEVTRVAREVGTEGKLGGQAAVKGVAGTWKDLTDNVNSMATNLTIQVRGIAKVVTAVANGDLTRKLVLEAKGEIAELADTINGMIETLSVFADQVTTVAREVGIEGKLGGQAHVPGAAGRWRDLTDNVNQLAGNLTTQVRAIADVATAVTQGDLTRSIAVQAAGEVAALKDNINEMIRNLKDTTRKNTEQDWLKTNLAKFTRMLQGQRDLLSVGKQILAELSPLVNAPHSVFYVTDVVDDSTVVQLLASYAYKERKSISNQLKPGEGLVGQCVLEKERILLTEVPPDYIKISSGLGEGTPINIVVLPVVFEGEVKAVIELGSFNRFTEVHLTFLEQLTESIGIVLNTISATTRTEGLLKQSQSLTEELTETNKRLEQQAATLQQSEELLKEQRRELQTANEVLEERAHLLSEQKNEVEQKNSEVERAKHLLEEKAEQLALTSKFKSEFLANMSHELRTPLNSLLILSQILSGNKENNLTPKQVEYAKTIYSSGSDLLHLINDILDLAKIESGTTAVEVASIPFNQICDFVDRNFTQVANSKRLKFLIDVDPNLPLTILTDGRHLQQILKNLLANAFKFTEQGFIKFSINIAFEGWSPDNGALNQAKQVVAFAVNDTGIGIAKDKHHLIFEAFQQADGTTSRRYGGTGLGLSISRQIANILGGEIKLESTLGTGSTFTLYLPIQYLPRAKRPNMLISQKMNESEIIYSGEETSALETSIALPHLENMESPTWDEQYIQPTNKLILIIEDDVNFAQVLMDSAKQLNFNCIAAERASQGLLLACKLRPAAIILDLCLPDKEGEVALACLKYNPETRHIPVYIISVTATEEHLKHGALAVLTKPVSQEMINNVFAYLKHFTENRPKHCMLAMNPGVKRDQIVDLLTSANLTINVQDNLEATLAELHNQTYHCVIVNSKLENMPRGKIMQLIYADDRWKNLPIIFYFESEKKFSKKEEQEFTNLTDKLNIRKAVSLAQLLDQATLLLHCSQDDFSPKVQQMIEQSYQNDAVLPSRKVLIIDDDIRNIFALTNALERYNMNIMYAENGKEGIRLLRKFPDIEMVLMDVMMPEMDGYEAIRTIRRIPEFKNLPVIALTAKVMKGDREKCLEAGASDYLPKPVDIDQLVIMLRFWLYPQVHSSTVVA